MEMGAIRQAEAEMAVFLLDLQVAGLAAMHQNRLLYSLAVDLQLGNRSCLANHVRGPVQLRFE